MSGIGFWELVVLFVIGLLILGPERLPRVATQIGRWVGRARRTANQLRYQIEREIALADIEKKTKDRSEPKREDDRSSRSEPERTGDEQGEAKSEADASGEAAAEGPASGPEAKGPASEPEAERPASEPLGDEAGAEDRKSS